MLVVIISSLLLKQMSIILADVGTASSYGPPYIREYTHHLFIQYFLLLRIHDISYHRTNFFPR
jgi:hypothetical protein